MNKEYWRPILIRAWHAVWETAGATLPATIVITPAMIEHFDIKWLLAVAAWAATALVAGALSIVKSLAVGVPEATAQDETDYISEITEDISDKTIQNAENIYDAFTGEYIHALDRMQEREDK